MIGILGYRGAVGKVVFNYLFDRYSIRCGGRKINKQEIINICTVEYMSVDVYNDESLKKFCFGCDIIINCVGPSYFVSEKILSIVETLGVSYVDAFGVNLFDLKKDYKIPIVVGAGSIPGLSGMLPAWVAQKRKEKNIRIKIFAGGKEKITKTACMDFLVSILKEFGKSGMYYAENRIKREIEEIALPTFFSKNALVFPYLTKELIQSAIDNRIKELHWYNVQVYPQYNEIMTSALLKVMKDTNYENLEQVSNEIIERIYQSSLKNDSRYKILVEVETDEADDSRILYAWEVDDSYMINGVISALCAEALYMKKCRNGIFWPYQILDVVETINILTNKNILNEVQFNNSISFVKEWEDEEI